MVKPFLSDKKINSSKITLVEKGEIINNEGRIMKKLSIHYPKPLKTVIRSSHPEVFL